MEDILPNKKKARIMPKDLLPRSISINSDGTCVTLIDQRKLPEKLEYLYVETWQEMVKLIQSLAVRGAPAIGIAGAFALVLFFNNQFGDICAIFTRDNALTSLRDIAQKIAQARPTAVNLQWALDKVLADLGQIPKDVTYQQLSSVLLKSACKIASDNEIECKSIGEHGAKLLQEGSNVLTHCNAGSLATAYYGTALGIIYAAFNQGKINHVFVDETRPLLQGARLSVWELNQAGIPVTLQCDNMAASLMRAHKVDAVIVGADRIAANGDVANKVGTYNLAILAQYHNIPFYVAAPTSTIDTSLQDGSYIPIEYRNKNEVFESLPASVNVYNPAFDVTDAQLITAIITEKGIFRFPYSF